jgi:hypothetical protein
MMLGKENSCMGRGEKPTASTGKFGPFGSGTATSRAALIGE